MELVSGDGASDCALVEASTAGFHGIVGQGDSCELPSQCVAEPLPQASSPRLAVAMGGVVFLFLPWGFLQQLMW